MNDSATWLFIVTSRPASGKSTLAKWLGERSALPVISKDGVVDTTDFASIDYERILARIRGLDRQSQIVNQKS